MSSKRPLVFDLDGTLIDSRGDIAGAVNHALEQLQRPALDIEVISSFVGNGAPYLLRRVAESAPGGPLPEDQLAALSAHFHSFYRAHPVDHSTVLPGVERCLEFADRSLAICTNKPRALTDLVVAGMGWDGVFRAVVGGGDTPQKKPHPAPLELIASFLEAKPNELIMVGDGPQDIGSGKAVGAHTIGVRGGFLDERLLEESRPDVILSSLVELPEYLDQMQL